MSEVFFARKRVAFLAFKRPKKDRRVVTCFGGRHPKPAGFEQSHRQVGVVQVSEYFLKRIKEKSLVLFIVGFAKRIPGYAGGKL